MVIISMCRFFLFVFRPWRNDSFEVIACALFSLFALLISVLGVFVFAQTEPFTFGGFCVCV